MMQGILGQFSKVEEEFFELQEAVDIGNRIHIAHELSDLYGAMKYYIEGLDFTMEEVIEHAACKSQYYIDQGREDGLEE